MTIDDIVANFDFLDSWEDRYRYLIELGRDLTPLPEGAHTDSNKVRGCASQVWLLAQFEPVGNEQRLKIAGDSDAHIVKGLVAIVIALYGGLTPQQILSTDALAAFERLGLKDHLTPQRSNGLVSMVNRIRADAQAALASG